MKVKAKNGEGKFLFDWNPKNNQVAIVIKDMFYKIQLNGTGNEASYRILYNGYPVKDRLKNIGFRWNGVEQVWEAACDESLIENLAELGIPRGGGRGVYYEIAKQDLTINAVVYIKAAGDTYSVKDVLKKHKFFYDKNSKSWRCKVPANNVKAVMMLLESDERLKDVTFKPLSR